MHKLFSSDKAGEIELAIEEAIQQFLDDNKPPAELNLDSSSKGHHANPQPALSPALPQHIPKKATPTG
jgi:hypothetical protein